MGTNIDGESAQAKLGEHSLAMSADGTRLIAGAFAYTSESKSQRGRVRAYEFLNGDWQPLGLLLTAKTPVTGWKIRGFYVGRRHARGDIINQER